MENQSKIMEKKLDLGCGRFKKSGFIGIDIVNYSEVDGQKQEVDIIHDLNKGIPFEDNEIDEVYTSHFLEHINDPYCFMKEIHRVCKPNAIVEIYVPLLYIVLPNHRTVFYNDWFERNLEKGKWKVDEKDVYFKQVKNGGGMALQYCFFELHIFLKVIK